MQERLCPFACIIPLNMGLLGGSTNLKARQCLSLEAGEGRGHPKNEKHSQAVLALTSGGHEQGPDWQEASG